MAKYTLTLEDDFNFDLIGFCSHQRDYRVCWAINNRLEIALEKSMEPYMVSNRKGEVVSSHSLYHFETEELTYYLIQNKSTNGFLVPERAQIDYFLVIKEANMVDVDELTRQLKEITEIQAVFIIDINTLKSASKFIF